MVWWESPELLALAGTHSHLHLCLTFNITIDDSIPIYVGKRFYEFLSMKNYQCKTKDVCARVNLLA